MRDCSDLRKSEKELSNKEEVGNSSVNRKLIQEKDRRSKKKKKDCIVRAKGRDGNERKRSNERRWVY